MRLNGYFRSGPLGGAYFWVILSIPSFEIENDLVLLVDMGATKTTILDSDAKRLGIPYPELSPLKQHPLLGIGGVVETFVAKDVSIYFKAEDSSEHKEDLKELLVVRHRRYDENIMRIPSVLGRDVLNKYHMVYDKNKRVILLTDEA